MADSHAKTIQIFLPTGEPRGINNHGEVVGAVADGAFIWDGVSGMQDLTNGRLR